ncbi:MAG: hypothetical protein JW737_04770 [Acidobacteria bacterium]|nr:hypothetical protein [Acidobacteriota bacterium]
MPNRSGSPGSGAGGRGRSGGIKRTGPGGNCICPKCGYKERHIQGSPCKKKKCPECGAIMIREETV